MKYILFFCCSISAFANVQNQISIKLDAGINTYRLINSGSAAGTFDRIASVPASWARIGIVIAPGTNIPPTASTTYTTCADPCGQSSTASLMTMNLQWGQTYIWLIRLDSDGTVHSPFTMTQVASSYVTGSCGGLGTMAMVEPAITTTSPLPMPREVVGQDCFVDAARIALQSGHASTSVRYWLRVHNPTYNQLLPARIDGKILLKVNSGSWISLTNSTSGLTAVDEARYQVVDNNSSQKLFGGWQQVREYIQTIPNGTISGGDTTVDQRLGFLGTDGITSGWRCLECFPIEGTDFTISSITCTSNSCVATATGSNFTSGDSVLVRGISGMRGQLNGPQVLTAASTNSFTFTPHTAGSGGSRPAIYVVPDGTYTVPVNRNPSTHVPTEQAVAYATRMLVAATAFTYPDGTVEASPSGGDVTKGRCLFTTGNESCTGGLFDQMYNPNLPYLNNVLHNDTCATCHGPTGWDLSYFKYSNNSIRQRSIFHSFTGTQGTYIASYIRSLDAASSPPYSAYPWNSPFQGGPGMDHYTWSISGGNLTNIVVAANHTAVATLTGTTDVRLNDPLNIHGVVSDTDLNTQTLAPTSTDWRVTGVAGGSIAFTVPSNVTAGTYNVSSDPNMVIDMGNNLAGGCGVDCVRTYGYDSDMFGSDRTKWVYTSNMDPRTAALPYQAPDWQRFWLATINPANVYPGSDFAGSAGQLAFANYYANITSGNFASYKSNTYAQSSGLNPYGQNQQYAGRSAGEGTTNFSLGNQAGESNPITHHLRESTFQIAAMQMFTLGVEKQLMPLYGQMMVDIHGSPTKTGCEPSWGLPGSFAFLMAPHVQKMYGGPPDTVSGVLEGYYSSWNGISFIWYDQTPLYNSNSCWGKPQDFIDSSYTENWDMLVGQNRANGLITFVQNTITAPQAGRENTNFIYTASQSDLDGLDWSPILRQNMFNKDKRASYYWFTAGDWQTLVNNNLTMQLALIADRNTGQWQTIVSNASGGLTTCAANGAAAVFSAGASLNICESAASNITYFKMFGANSTNLSTYKAWAHAVWPLHDFDADEAAGIEGDQYNDYGTGDLSSAGSGKTITFSTACPMTASGTPLALVIGGGSGGRTEWFFVGGSPPLQGAITGGTCVKGSPGTLIVTTQYAHTGSWKATVGLSPNNIYSNWYGASFDQATTGWFQGSNMVP